MPRVEKNKGTIGKNKQGRRSASTFCSLGWLFCHGCLREERGGIGTLRLFISVERGYHRTDRNVDQAHHRRLTTDWKHGAEQTINRQN